METLLLDLMGQRKVGEHLLRAIERTGIDRRTHRRRALSLLMNLPKVCGDGDADQRAWIDSVHAQVEQLDLPLPPGATMRGLFRRPRNGQWSSHLRIPVELGLVCAKIHEAKGRQYDAVCVVIPPNRAPENRVDALFASWSNRTDTEAKRVIYVGVTRALHLSAIAVPMAFADRCADLMAAGQVPHNRTNV